ncbi:hypothetical protein NUU61_006700 [Penicillium alfredii]|uniref:Uncharacterized protein n=1 Tax=Penicillium alfredii TaxID=1506179 RepID=A0A9W9K3V6_9EURO|nr:uncharacterized protein NUU61_006700 [Penicillium alfredii]KAJ5091830.1 hypothetical protein NUU61_006700 [Penicillium alfredii]
MAEIAKAQIADQAAVASFHTVGSHKVFDNEDGLIILEKFAKATRSIESLEGQVSDLESLINIMKLETAVLKPENAALKGELAILRTENAACTVEVPKVHHMNGLYLNVRERGWTTLLRDKWRMNEPEQKIPMRQLYAAAVHDGQAVVSQMFLDRRPRTELENFVSVYGAEPDKKCWISTAIQLFNTAGSIHIQLQELRPEEQRVFDELVHLVRDSSRYEKVEEAAKRFPFNSVNEDFEIETVNQEV